MGKVRKSPSRIQTVSRRLEEEAAENRESGWAGSEIKGSDNSPATQDGTSFKKEVNTPGGEKERTEEKNKWT